MQSRAMQLLPANNINVLCGYINGTANRIESRIECMLCAARGYSLISHIHCFPRKKAFLRVLKPPICTSQTWIQGVKNKTFCIPRDFFKSSN